MCAIIVAPCRVNVTVPDPAEAGGRGGTPRLDQYTGPLLVLGEHGPDPVGTNGGEGPPGLGRGPMA
jgi:hypothetical protein